MSVDAMAHILRRDGRTAGLLSRIGMCTAPKRIRTCPFSTVIANVVSSRCAATVAQSLMAKTRVLPCSLVPSGRGRAETGSKAERGEVMPAMVLAFAGRGNVHVSGDGT